MSISSNRAAGWMVILGVIRSMAAPADVVVPQTPADASTALEEIVVTAERRESTLQKTSLALQVVSLEELKNAGVVQARDLVSVVPGLQIGQGGPATQIYIRGVGDFGTTPISNPAVAFNVDGVYVARPQAVEGNFFDVERVEVLKGPQGTLYGRNASGGAINVVTQAPVLGTFGAYAEVEGGNFGEAKVEGAINLPVGSQFALRLSLQSVARDGHLSQGEDDDHHQSGRIQALWSSDNISVLLGSDYIHMGGVGAGIASIPIPGANNGSAWTSAQDPRLAPYYYAAAAAQGFCAPGGFFPGVVNPGACPHVAPYPAPPFPPGTTGPYTSLIQLPTGSPRQDNVFWSVHANVSADLGWATLTVLPAYRSASLDYNTYPLFNQYENPADSHATSVEARLSNNTAALKWVGGLYYFHEIQDSTELIDAGLLQNNVPVTEQSTRSEAAFGEVTYSVTDTLRFIAGARYTDDLKTIDGAVTSLPPSVEFLPNPANPKSLECFAELPNPCLLETYAGSRSFVKSTYKVGIEQDLTPKNMLYATVSTGFKAGGFDQSANEVPGSHEAQSFQPETLTAYEIGSKNRFIDDRLQVNFEGFYWKYHDHQEPRLTLDGQGAIAYDTLNAGNATLYGVDLDVVARATPTDTLRGAVEYLHTLYNSFTYDVPPDAGGAPFARGAGNGFTSLNPLSPLAATTGCAVSTIASGSMAGGQHVDCSGYSLTHAPRFSGSFGYEHRFGLSNGNNVTAALDSQFATSRYLADDFLPSEKASSYISENAYLTYHASEDKWSLQFFVRNLSDRVIYTSAFEYQVAGYVAANISAPRTYGARATVHF